MNAPANQRPRELATRVLGYLNFSSGSEDLAMLRDLNELFALCQDPQSNLLPHEHVATLLNEQLDSAESESQNKVLQDATQARQVLELTFQHVLPAYHAHHRDLLFHRDSASLFNSFFVGRVFEAVLQFSQFLQQPDKLVPNVVGKLNDFIGHRPVAILETQKREPYEHEWVRPIPIYIGGAGVAQGPYQEVVSCAIELLQKTDNSLLQMAQFDPQLLDELAIDPRSFDFDHPVNKRPNHHFGQWDEHHLDNDGNYRRFVIHQVTLDALTSRTHEQTDLPREQLVFEAGSVLAGTILMAAGICGYGPGAHDSTVTLANLLPMIAHYRDQFYAQLMTRLAEPHRTRLIEEATFRQQPFGAARQHLNRQLARNRAFQMVHVNLAQVFSRMGYTDAAFRHANVLPVASARMQCQIECLMYSGDKALQTLDLPTACETLPRLFELVLRAVNCGAMIDPWNILGFDANYNLFHGTENSVRDHRADDLIELMEQVFSFASRVWIAAQANDEQDLSDRVSKYFRKIIDWWHRFAVHQVSSVDAVNAEEIFSASKEVAELINEWQKSGAQSGDVQFWAQRAQLFTSARAYILAIDTLIARHDFVTSMALLIHWLTQNETIPLQRNAGSFQTLAARWFAEQKRLLQEDPTSERYTETWNRIRKFCDYVEANAGEFWNVPKFSFGTKTALETTAENELTENADDDQDLYNAAYEDMVYRESTDDGIDSSIYDPSQKSDDSIQEEMHRVIDRLEFLQALTDYWVESALFVVHQQKTAESLDAEFFLNQRRTIHTWAQQAQKNSNELQDLIRSVQSFSLPKPHGSLDSLSEYDRQRLYKETLLDHAINLRVDTSTASCILSSVSAALAVEHQLEPLELSDFIEDEEQQLWIAVLSSLLRGDCQVVSKKLDDLVALLTGRSLLYVPLSKGGDPLKIVATRTRQCLISQLVDNLPALGLLHETRELLHVSLLMERNQRVRQGSVTEFDDLFHVGYTAMVETLIRSHQRDNAKDSETTVAKSENDTKPAAENKTDSDSSSETTLFTCLEMLAESMWMLWLTHSQTLRLSVLEKVRKNSEWESMVQFIEKFGDRIFTQQFLNLSNIRAVLHQGVETWLESVERQQSDHFGCQFLEKIESGYPREDAIRNLTWVLEAIIENFNEYRDYNCTTTQSDNGRMLHVFLDFLRLRSRYDQVCWNLKPVIWAHESLVRFEQNQVASKWRRLLSERVKPEADKLETRLGELQNTYSIQMATVSQRINERFVHPMQVDRLTSLVGKAMQDPGLPESQSAFELIENYAEMLTQQPIGVGFELPDWIIALQNEVDAQVESNRRKIHSRHNTLITHSSTSYNELVDQVKHMPRRSWDLEEE